MQKLYWATNTISIAVAIALNEGGVHYEAIQLDFNNGEQTKPEYHAINPKGRVPALTTPEGILTETGAILEYLGETAIPDLIPADPLHRARMREAMFYLASTMHPNHAHKMRGSRWADKESSFEDMRVKVPETMTASSDYVESLIVGPLIFGENLTAADAYLYVVSTWLEGDGVNMGDFPKLTAFRAAMEQRPSVKRAWDEGMLT